MDNGFPYFQFCPDRWLSGKISSFDLDEQGLFLHLCMTSWIDKGVFNICSTLLQRKFRKSKEWVETTVESFVECGIIERSDDGLRIKFIEAQLAGVLSKRELLSAAGRASAKARQEARKKEPKKDNTKKSREEKRRVDCSTSVEHLLNECSLFSSPEFATIWKSWEKHRIEIKKPLTGEAIKKQLAKLESWGIERATAAISNSIANGWQGIFEDKNCKPASVADRKQEAYEIELARQRARGGLPFDEAATSEKDKQAEKRRLFHWAACDGKCKNWNTVNMWCEKDVKKQPVKAEECREFENTNSASQA
jgi:hypothetical protein